MKQSPRMGVGRHLLVLVSLIALSGSVQVWMVSRAVVPAQDAVRNVAIAQLIERDGLWTTWQGETGRPVFPLLVEATHELWRPWLGSTRDGWARSVQIAAAVPLVITVVPLYLLLVRLLDARSAAAGTMLFCVMTEPARLGADGIADSTHLLFFTVAMLAAVIFFDRVTTSLGESKKRDGMSRRAAVVAGLPTVPREGETFGRRGDAVGRPRHNNVGRPRHNTSSAEHRRDRRNRRDPLAALCIAMAGAACGVALLAKSEAMVLIAVIAASIVLLQVRAAWRQPWPRVAVGLGCFALALMSVVTPYVLLAGPNDTNEALAVLRGRNDPADWTILNPPPASDNVSDAAAHRAGTIQTLRTWRLADGERLSFAAKERGVSSRFHGYRAAVGEFLSEIGLALHYFMLPLVVFGVWRSPRTRMRAAHGIMIMFCVTYAAVALHHAATAGYLSTRHVLPLVVLAVGWAGRGALELGPLLATAVTRLQRAQPRRDVFRPAVGWAIVVLVAVGCLPRTLAPLHQARAAHRQAAEWLATQSQAGDRVLDVRGWTGLYSGRTTYRYHGAKSAFSDTRLAFVVTERRELEYDSRRSRTLRRLLDESAIEAAAFSHPDGRAEKDVIVYRWDAARFAQRLDASILAN